MKSLLAIAVPLFAVDQLTKWWVLTRIPYESEVPVIPGFFSLVHLHNTGAAFSAFTNQNGAFLVLASVAVIVVCTLAWKGKFHGAVSKTAAGLLLSGIAGNLLDRIVHHYVVDFLLFDLHVPFANPWPAFNVADSCICIAAVLFILDSLKKEQAKKVEAS